MDEGGTNRRAWSSREHHAGDVYCASGIAGRVRVITPDRRDRFAQRPPTAPSSGLRIHEVNAGCAPSVPPPSTCGPNTSTARPPSCKRRRSRSGQPGIMGRSGYSGFLLRSRQKPVRSSPHPGISGAHPDRCAVCIRSGKGPVHEREYRVHPAIVVSRCRKLLADRLILRRVVMHVPRRMEHPRNGAGPLDTVYAVRLLIVRRFAYHHSASSWLLLIAARTARVRPSSIAPPRPARTTEQIACTAQTGDTAVTTFSSEAALGWRRLPCGRPHLHPLLGMLRSLISSSRFRRREGVKLLEFAAPPQTSGSTLSSVR